MTKTRILVVLFLFMFIGLSLAVYFFYAVYGGNTVIPNGETIITIHEDDGYDDVKTMLTDSQFIKSSFTYDLVAKFMNYNDGNIKDGKYKIKDGWNNRDLIGILRSGNQVPINVTFNNVRNIEELSGKLAPYFASDSLDILKHFTSEETLNKMELNKENIMTLFIPNTYQMYWNASPAAILERNKKEYNSFWNNDNRKEKAQDLELSKAEVYTLASIVEKETNHKAERKRMAGVYLNRLKRGIPLQADPTVVYAVGDFSIRRVLNVHLEYDSPYNTYKYAGLPPGPIYMPSVNSIDAVLNAEEHDYLYFCAKPGYDGAHLFAKTLRQHNVNANKYRQWLNSEGIR
jgi:UPF0755 protein